MKQNVMTYDCELWWNKRCSMEILATMPEKLYGVDYRVFYLEVREGGGVTTMLIRRHNYYQQHDMRISNATDESGS